MSQKVNILNPLSRDGTSQTRRFNNALDPSNIKIDERTDEEFKAFIVQYAELVQYYNNKHHPEGNWQTFFTETNLGKSHYALFEVFLKLFGYARNQLNQIPRKHLDFYFTEVLGLRKKPADPDKVHVIFEPVKDAPRVRVKQGTKLSAGEDKTGVDLQYRTNRELVVNQARVNSLKTVFVDFQDQGRIYAADVANSSDGKGAKLPENDPKWNTFGESQREVPRSLQTMQRSTLGFSVATPNLYLNGGKRTIHFKFKTTELISDQWLISRNLKLKSVKFNAFYSNHKDWIGPFNVSIDRIPIDGIQNQGLYFKLELGPELPPVEPFKEAPAGSQLSKWPIIKLVLDEKTEDYCFQQLMSIKFSKVIIDVEVKGLKNLTLQNDINVLSTDKPFHPFGTVPSLGSNFYIGSQEAFSKKLSSLSISIDWHQLPSSNLGDYYRSYIPQNDKLSLSNESFKVSADSLYDQSWHQIDVVPLFNLKDATTQHHFNLTPDPRWRFNRDIQPPTPIGVATNRGFIRLQLTSPLSPFKAFGHQEYPGIYTEAIIKKTTKDDKIGLPQKPYTPVIKGFSIDYRAIQEIELEKPQHQEEATQPFEFFHNEPFGYLKILDLGKRKVSFLLPQYPNEGNLYIGLTDLNPPEQLSLLFQAAEGTGNPALALEEKDILWSYLTTIGWQSFSGLEKLMDSTGGLLKSGIVIFDVPEATIDYGTLMPHGKFWLRASVKKNSAGASKLIDVLAQAVEATFFDLGNNPDHLRKPLPAESITELVDKEPAIQNVLQPYASFGGKTEEQANDFDIRVSERLRHKDRAINIWDYERLILERFPSIFQVRCINHTNKESEFKPGSVTVVVIPNLRNINAANSLEPKVSVHVLNKIKEYISQFVSPFVELNVINPEYEQLMLEFKVGFHKGFDAGFYGRKLNEELKRFLSPWAYDEGMDVVFGGKIYKSMILAFVEERQYVDFVTQFKMYHNITESYGIGHMIIGKDFGISNEDGIIKQDLEVAEATSSRAILVSYPEHAITVVSEEETCKGSRGLGIGYMAVDIDFNVK